VTRYWEEKPSIRGSTVGLYTDFSEADERQPSDAQRGVLHSHSVTRTLMPEMPWKVCRHCRAGARQMSRLVQSDPLEGGPRRSGRDLMEVQDGPKRSGARRFGLVEKRRLEGGFRWLSGAFAGVPALDGATADSGLGIRPAFAAFRPNSQPVRAGIFTPPKGLEGKTGRIYGRRKDDGARSARPQKPAARLRLVVPGMGYGCPAFKVGSTKNLGRDRGVGTRPQTGADGWSLAHRTIAKGARAPLAGRDNYWAAEKSGRGRDCRIRIEKKLAKVAGQESCTEVAGHRVEAGSAPGARARDSIGGRRVQAVRQAGERAKRRGYLGGSGSMLFGPIKRGTYRFTLAGHRFASIRTAGLDSG